MYFSWHPLAGPPETKPISAKKRGSSSITLTCHHRTIDAMHKFLIKFLSSGLCVCVLIVCCQRASQMGRERGDGGSSVENVSMKQRGGGAGGRGGGRGK